MKLSIQDGMLPGRDLAEKLDRAALLGFEGVEVGGRMLLRQFEETARAFEGHPVRLSSICSGYTGCLIAASKEEREQASSEIMRLLEAGGALGAVGLISVPCFGAPTLPDLSPWKDAPTLERALLVDMLGPIAAKGAQTGCLLLVEPLNRYETHLLNRLEDAVAVVKKVKGGIAMMADLFHMSIEEDSIPAAIRAAGRRIRHVHLADSQRLQPGTGMTNFRAAFKALQDVGFSDYMALECGIRGRRMDALKDCVSFLRECMC